jgi:hypothetical protein
MRDIFALSWIGNLSSPKVGADSAAVRIRQPFRTSYQPTLVVAEVQPPVQGCVDPNQARLAPEACMKRFILTILVLAVLVMIVGVATGFVDLSSSGQLRAPKVNVSAEGGEVPKLDVDTKELVVGTTETNVAVPTIGMEKSKINVPTIGVKDNGDGNQQQPN